ncbi:MAG: sugar transferase [Bacilli bacterium]|nr:sugar transferase [Bacilli bacterium]
MYKYVKRFLDFLLSFILLIILFIPMCIISLLIKIEDKGFSVFRQERTGKDGKTFELLKFRSMKINNNVRDFSKCDEYTKIGKFIRKTSLDELPQLFNILKGDMSFIGPRPWIPEYYENMNENQRHKYDVLPGLTGLAQASGRNGISIFDKINYDLEYVEKYSFKEDLYVVFKTIYTVLKKEDVDIGKQGIKSELDQLKDYNKTSIDNQTDVSNKQEVSDLEEQLVGA